jgi:hypothetical protein
MFLKKNSEVRIQNSGVRINVRPRIQTRMALRKHTALALTGSQPLGWEPIREAPPPVA